MGFSTKYSKKLGSYELISEGDYEVIIKNAEERTTNGGKKYLNLWLVIRNDVEQKYKNRYIFHTLWKRKEPTEADMQVEGYGFGWIMMLAESAGLPSGKNYETIGDFCKDLTNRTLLVSVEHDDYNGSMREKVVYINETQFPVCKHIFNKNSVTSDEISQNSDEKFVNSNKNTLDDFEEILSDEDVPF